ncbi:MAG: acyltransferase [Cyanobacteria bacterium]|nr:acyltransferase [Cyanobacteriota bacterium]
MALLPSPPVDQPAPPPQAPAATKRFSFLDALRGLAAVWIVLYHAASGGHTPLMQQTWPTWLFEGLLGQGFLGVPIFFVLSGFVLSYTTRKLQLTWPLFNNALARRWTRLSPPYYASMVLVLVLALAESRIRGQELWLPSWGNVVAHVLYLQRLLEMRDINAAYWALCIEVQFFLVYFALVAVQQRLGRSPRLAPWVRGMVFGPCAAIAILWPLGVIDPHWLSQVWFLPHWHAFLLGMLAQWTLDGRIRSGWFYGYGTVILGVGLGHQYWFAVTAALTAIAIAALGQINRLNVLNWRWLQFLGLISYSLYITHPPVSGAALFVGRTFLFDVSSATGESLNIAFHLGVCIAVAAAFWYLIERPSIQWSQRLRPKPTDS